MGKKIGILASFAILFIVIIALSGLGVVVVKALGGESVTLMPGSKIVTPTPIEPTQQTPTSTLYQIPAKARITYPNGTEFLRSEPFTIEIPSTHDALASDSPQSSDASNSSNSQSISSLDVPPKSFERIRGSSWGTFTIACTIPIALFVGWYMYRFRKGHVVEASLIGAAAVLVATVAGAWIPGSPIEHYFLFSRDGIIAAICLYGFIASVLPVWLLLCPRDYLSSFLKIGTIGLLMLGVIVANPKLEAPAVNSFFANGGGPNMAGAIFPFVFICIMCGAVSGFHALVSSGTTPKMVSNENDLRMIGYGSMLMEGLVAVCALIAAAALPQGDYWAINIDMAKAHQYADTLTKMHADIDHLDQIETQVGGETLRGRTGGAVTLAVGMAQIMTQAISKFSSADMVDSLIKYWFHFAIMFEALFILTTIDTGTRIARFLLQELLGNVSSKFQRMDWWPGVWISTALVTLGWGSLIWSGSIQTIWPMFGIANQLLAAIALCTVTTWLFQEGRGRFTWVTILPMLFVTTTTFTAAAELVQGTFWPDLVNGLKSGNVAQSLRGGLSGGAIILLVISYTIILANAIAIWVNPKRSIASQTRIS
jgi:carbon starvation protein